MGEKATDSLAVNLALTLIIVVLAVPGLVIEPGPFSEIVAGGLFAAVWGLDFDGGGGG